MNRGWAWGSPGMGVRPRNSAAACPGEKNRDGGREAPHPVPQGVGVGRPLPDDALRVLLLQAVVRGEGTQVSVLTAGAA